MTALKLVKQHKSDKEIRTSLTSLFDEYDREKEGVLKISNFVSGKDDLITYFLNGNKASSIIAKDIFCQKGALAALNSRYWSKAMNETDVLDCMPAKKRNDWFSMIRDNKTPDFERQTVLTTLETLLLSRDQFFAEKVDGVFRNLSREHVTNSPMGFKKRMIVNYILDVTKGHNFTWYSVRYDVAQYVQDLRNVICKLQNTPEQKTRGIERDLRVIADNEEFGQWHEFDRGAFRLRLYKKGTAHIEINEEIARKLNQVLATLYPSAIPTQHRKPEKARKTKSPEVFNQSISFEVREVLSDSLQKFSKGRGHYLGLEKLSRVDLETLKGVLKMLGATENNGSWKFDYNPTRMISKIVRSGTIPELKSHQFYPTPESLSQRAQGLLDIEEEDSILEPSAGRGDLLKDLEVKSITCIEKSELFSAILTEKGFETLNEDFLENSLGEQKFDKILMNPPFSKNQAEAHVRKAICHLADKGKLVAILPASLKNKEFSGKHVCEYSEVIENAFESEGTRVSVVLLKLSN